MIEFSWGRWSYRRRYATREQRDRALANMTRTHLSTRLRAVDPVDPA